MQSQIEVFIAILALSIPIISVSGERGGFGYACSTSEGCASPFECKLFFGGYRCLRPGSLVLDAENKASGTAFGKLCENDDACIHNAECAIGQREFIKTCRCIKGMKPNGAGSECLPQTTFEDIMTFIADPIFFVCYIVTILVALIKICCCRGGKK